MNITILISIIVAATAFATLLFREVQRRGDNLQTKVDQAVDARMGSLFVSIRDLEASAQKSFQAQVDLGTAQLDTVVKRGEEVVQQVERQLASLQERAVLTERLDGLLRRADEVVPRVESSQAVIPAQLITQIANASAEQLPSLIGQLLEHPASSAQQLEAGGDLAREVLQDTQLALKLYDASTRKAPARVSARAEFLALQVAEGSEEKEADSAFSELLQLAEDHPDSLTVYGRAMDSFIRRSDYRGLQEFMERALAGKLTSKSVRASLTRNLAVAAKELGESHDKIMAAYAVAMEAAYEVNDGTTISNLVRPYASYLLGRNMLDEAEKVALEALRGDPTESQLYITLGEVAQKRNKYDRAERCFELGVRYGNPSETAAARRGLIQTAALQELDLLTVSGTAETASSADHGEPMA